MRQEQGIVLFAEGDMARVKVGRHAECTGCGACPATRQETVDAVNRVGAAAGQRVRFEVQEEHIFLGAFVVFWLPLISAGMGAFLGWQAALVQGAEENDCILGGAAAAFLFSLAVVRWFDRRLARKKEMKPVIVELLQDKP